MNSYISKALLLRQDDRQRRGERKQVRLSRRKASDRDLTVSGPQGNYVYILHGRAQQLKDLVLERASYSLHVSCVLRKCEDPQFTHYTKLNTAAFSLLTLALALCRSTVT